MAVGLFLVVGSALLLASPAKAVDTFNPFTDQQAPQAGCQPAAQPFLGFPVWYKYLDGEAVTDSNGVTVCRPHFGSVGDVWLVVAVILEIILRLSGMAAVGFLIWGGFQYVMSQGASDRLSNARNVIANAIAGLIITIFATRIVGYIAARFAGNTDANFLLPSVAVGNGTLTIVINLAFQFGAALAVIFTTIGAITIARSNGDSGAVQRGRQTIIYALVGLGIMLVARGVIDFIIGRL